MLVTTLDFKNLTSNGLLCWFVFGSGNRLYPKETTSKRAPSMLGFLKIFCKNWIGDFSLLLENLGENIIIGMGGRFSVTSFICVKYMFNIHMFNIYIYIQIYLKFLL